MKLCQLFIFFAALWSGSNASRILMVVSTYFHSHLYLAERLVQEIVSRGHEVYMISPRYQQSTTNFTHCLLNGIDDAMRKMYPNEVEQDLFELGKKSFWDEYYSGMKIGTIATEISMSHPCFQNLIRDPNEHFDLVILEMFFSELLFGMAHRFDAPVVVLATFGSSIWTNHLVGNPAPTSYVPLIQAGHDGKMTLVERMKNLAKNLMIEMLRKYVFIPQVDISLHKHFPDAPSIFDLMYNRTAIVLLNTNPAISEARPHMPAMIEIGGFHVKDPKPLPADLEKIMNEAPYGVILFSMGSALKSQDVNNATKTMLLRTFSRLKQKVIWKGEDHIPGSPENVVFLKWCPQNDILAHPNLKMFISHGGILSVTEAVTHGVPILLLPVFGDQPMNSAIASRKGYGLQINFFDLTEQRLYSGIREVLTNPKYKNAAAQASKNLRNQPIKPVDKAMFWIDYVIENRGAKHLRCHVMDLEWYQVYSVDTTIIFLCFLFLCSYIVRLLVRRFYRKIRMTIIKKKVL